jgi:hypothetical protein
MHEGNAGTDVAVRASTALSIVELTSQVQLIQEAMATVMKENEHYGVIPGTNKPTLLKSGAEKLGLLFRLVPRYQIREEHDTGGHYTVTVTCELEHAPTGTFAGSGLGRCSTLESKYAWRTGKAACPKCGGELGFSRKTSTWFCPKGKGGCGAGYKKEQIVAPERVPNPDLPDVHNTVLKMACKRAHVAATLSATAASDIFTQDLEDSFGGSHEPAPPPPVVSDDPPAHVRLLLDTLAQLEAAGINVTPAGMLAQVRQKLRADIVWLDELTEQEVQTILEGLQRAQQEREAAATTTEGESPAEPEPDAEKPAEDPDDIPFE